MRADRRDPVIASLRRHKPTRFEATLRDGAKKSITLSTKQNRWEILSETLDALPWVTIEALDDKGGVLGVVERDSDEMDPLEEDEIDRAGRFAVVLATVQRDTMAECRKMFEVVMRSHADMASSMVEASRAVTAQYELALKVQAATMGQAAPEEQDGVMKLMQMAMALKMGHTPTVQLSATPPAKPAPTAPATNGKKA